MRQKNYDPMIIVMLLVTMEGAVLYYNPTHLRTSFLGASIGSALVFLAQKILDRHTHVLRLLHGCFRPTARAHKDFTAELVARVLKLSPARLHRRNKGKERERDTGRDMVNIELFLLSFVTLCR